MIRFSRRAVAICSALALAAGLSACSGGSGGGGGEAGDTIVAETSFNLKTIDPHRQFEFTGSTIDDAISVKRALNASCTSAWTSRREAATQTSPLAM